MTEEASPEDIAQAAKQCRAVVHLATCIATVHRQKAEIIEAGGSAFIVPVIGRHTASIMEDLGNILNNMDAVDPEEDAWLDPIYDEAHRRWPIT